MINIFILEYLKEQTDTLHLIEILEKLWTCFREIRVFKKLYIYVFLFSAIKMCDEHIAYEFYFLIKKERCLDFEYWWCHDTFFYK